MTLVGKHLPANAGDKRDIGSIPLTPVFSPGESPWIEEPGELESTGSHRVRHD